MSSKGRACVIGAYEHPLRAAAAQSVASLHAETARGALSDAGLEMSDIDGYFCAGDAPGLGPLSMVDYLGLRVRYADSTDIGGSSPILHLHRAAQAIALGKCTTALITLAGRPRAEAAATATKLSASLMVGAPEVPFEAPYGADVLTLYAMAARRHMHEYGTTSEQLAWIKVAASHHAQHNPHAVLQDVVTVDDVLGSPLVADPLHRLDCCVVSDGGAAIVVTTPDIAASLGRPVVTVVGGGEAIEGRRGGTADITTSAAVQSGAEAFAEAGLTPRDIDYAGIYDGFTITALVQIEDLGFCEKGGGGRFVADGNLISGVGSLPFNTDGGSLCNSHPGHRGGMTKIVEAVRQLRGEAHPAVQLPDCGHAVVNGIGGWLPTRHSSATIILERS